jgi:hypothetical protein
VTLVVQPLAIIFVTVGVIASAFVVSHVSAPFAFVSVTGGKPASALTPSFAVVPLTVISIIVTVHHCANTLSSAIRLQFHCNEGTSQQENLNNQANIHQTEPHCLRLSDCQAAPVQQPHLQLQQAIQTIDSFRQRKTDQ